ncbi:ribokinase [Maribacter sp. ANRC-HE7]|uniref:Ribokinase n=1 Tax=Maribacter aquimaris TaxID=2737171 RepID=A0ABR7UZX1_9FLAO|nr:ribokinase [Maribacter aquimaris]MBD0777851.1 ribokinase [Maribacter aquimaris]
MILVIGSSNTDFIATMKKLPVSGETVIGTSFLQVMGGKGGNQAMAAHRLGGDVQFITCLGKDVNGKNTIEYYKKQKLDVSLSLTVDKVPSGTAMIWVDEKGENRIVVNSGANGKLSPEYIDQLEEVIAKASIVVIQMEIPYGTVKKICEIAHRNNTKILLNVAPACKIDSEIIKMINVLVVNETEAEIISGESIASLGVAAVVDKLRLMGARTVVLTLGKNGCFLKNDETFFRVPAYEVETIDTTAAGDVFCGALAVGLWKKQKWEEILEFATAASALCVMRLGAQPSIPTKSEVDEYLNKNEMVYRE